MLPLLPLLLATAVSSATITVQVGPDSQLVFQPDNVEAAVGDQVVFHFNPKNHSVTQSSLANPCAFNGGINSGFMPVSTNTTNTTFTIQVNDTNPIWIYCAQGAGTAASHCAQGMVFAINCGPDGSNNSFSAFQQAAIASGKSLPSSLTTAAYGGVTIPAAPSLSVVTETVTLGSQIWTTTYSSYPDSPGPTPAAVDGQIHTIIVGGDGILAYNPPHISASPRDIVVFEFHQKNHTVTESSFEDPCRPLSALDASGASGFDSGFMPVAENATTFPTFNFTVTTTSPIWAYCRQTGHCGDGMVFAINSDESSPRNFTAFQDLAKTLNGTATSSGTSPSSTKSSAVSAHLSSFGLAFVLPLAYLVW